jgi:hypothetical protein
VSALLRQGQPANQVAVLLPTDDAWASFSPSHTTVTGAMSKLISPALMGAILSAGYNVDYIDAEAIDKVGFGTHSVLVIPPTDRIPVETMRKIHAWVEHGGKVISVGHAPSLSPEGKASVELTKLTEVIAVVPDEAQLGQALHNAVAADLRLTASPDQIGFIRRKLAASDTYFVVNTSNQPVDTTASFGTAYKQGVAVDPDSMATTSASADGQAIHLAPYESRFFLFSAGAGSAKPAMTATKMFADLSSDWKVTFVATGKSEVESKLTDWTAKPETLHYSGEVVYTRDVTVNSVPGSPVYFQVDGGTALPGSPNSPPEHAALGPDGLPNPLVTRTGPGMHAYYDPPIREAALVVVNGQAAGALWHPPYRLDVTKLLKAGNNHIEIHVYNTALNAWSALPPHDYGPLIEKYGDRFQMQDLNQVKPISSGLLGPIHLVTESPQ